MEKTIWILEDDEGAGFVYQAILGIRYDLRFFSTIRYFMVAMGEVQSGISSSPPPSLVIADLRLADDTFLTVLTSPKQKSILGHVPFIVVSSLDDLDVLRLCFQEGALDCITKPFGKGELVVKVERILGNQTVGVSSRPGPLFGIDPVTLTVTLGNRSSQPLTSKEFQIFTLLNDTSAKSGALPSVSRQEIIGRVWGSVQVNPKALDVHLGNLRKKLAPLGLEIQTSGVNSYRLKTD